MTMNSPSVRTFLVANIRGYTRLTVEHGNEAAARLAERFAAIIRELVAAHGGEVIGSRGGEAVAAFVAPGKAIGAAIELQGRCSREAEADPSLSMRVGIGLDAGDAVRSDGDYVSVALLLAGRMGDLAGPGEVLATEVVIQLAGRVEAVRYEDRGAVQARGFQEPVRVMQVVSE